MGRIWLACTSGLAIAVIGANSQAAQNVSFSFLSTTSVLYEADASDPTGNTPSAIKLSAGAAATAGDGALIRIYAEDVDDSLILLSEDFTVGDTPAAIPGGFEDGRFSFSLALTSAQIGLYEGLPIRVRVYDDNTLATSQFYADIVNPGWKVPADSPAVALPINLTDAGTVGLDNAGGFSSKLGDDSGFYTNILVPEPSVMLLGALGLGAIAARRRKR